MKKVMKMRDVNSSDIIPIWEDIRIEDMNGLCNMPYKIKEEIENV